MSSKRYEVRVEFENYGERFTWTSRHKTRELAERKLETTRDHFGRCDHSKMLNGEIIDTGERQ